MKYSINELRSRIAREESRAARKIKKIAAGTYNPRGKRSRLYDITQANRATRGEIPMPAEGLAPHYGGVDITGTERDPRRDSRRLRRPGLERYLEDLRTFNSGLVNYFKAADGSVVTGQEIRASRHYADPVTEPFRIGRERRARRTIRLNDFATPRSRVLDANDRVRIPWLGGSTLGAFRRNMDAEDLGYGRSNESIRPLSSAELRPHILGHDPDAETVRGFQVRMVSQFHTLPTDVRDALLAMDPVRFLVAWEAGGEFADAITDLYQESKSLVEDDGLEASTRRAREVIEQANGLKVE